MRAIATLTWPALIAPVLGPPLGGLIVEHGDWRTIFYLNLPLGVLAFLLAWRLVPDSGERAKATFDWLGFILIGGATGILLFATEVLGRQEINWSEASALVAIGAVILVVGIRHLRMIDEPMMDLGSFRLGTFAVTIWGGSLFRMGVSAVPFLLPLMFQIQFGFNAFDAGLMLMAVFAGNLVMKPMTTTILRRYGFRRVLIANGIINAVTIATCAVLTPSLPQSLVYMVLFMGGMSRSMQFTALNTIAFADVSDDDMSSANTLFSTAFQLAMGLGVALGAIAWRVGERIAATEGTAGPFQIAFLIVATVSLLGVWDSLRLEAGAGASTLGLRKDRRQD